MKHPMLSVALHAARKAGDILSRYYEWLDAIKIDPKDQNDCLLKINKGAEATITEIIRKFYPQHSIFIKKNPRHPPIEREVQWIINPLDGTSNFIKRLPYFSISIAVRIKGRTEVAVVYDPIHNDLFTATRGRGAQLNGYRLRSSSARNLNASILATGFPFKAKQHTAIYVNILYELFTECFDFRTTGSTALNLAYLAAGRVDGYFEIALKPWDVIAGELIAHEAGALVCDFTGGHSYMITGNLIAANPQILKGILTKIRNAQKNSLESSL